jgi:hypothetical protein
MKTPFWYNNRNSVAGVTMMKRIAPYLLLIAVCVSVSFADYIDGFITAGEYEYFVEWNSYNPPLIVEGGGRLD